MDIDSMHAATRFQGFTEIKGLGQPARLTRFQSEPQTLLMVISADARSQPPRQRSRRADLSQVLLAPRLPRRLRHLLRLRPDRRIASGDSFTRRGRLPEKLETRLESVQIGGGVRTARV